MNFQLRVRHRLIAGVLILVIPFSATYAFSDNEARTAILELRQRVDSQRQTMDQQANSILSLTSQIQDLRSEISVLRGRVEQLERSTDAISSQTSPRDVTVDGKTFTAKPQEVSDYDAGMSRLRDGDYAGAVTLFQNFMTRWPDSGYKDSVYFWLGNAQYGNRQYQEAIKSFTNLIDRSPNHVRSPDALLSIANCYLALKNTSAMRATLERVLKEYPQSEAANQARSRLSQT